MKLALEALINDAANDDDKANDTNDDYTNNNNNNDDVGVIIIVGVVVIVGIIGVVGVIVGIVINIICFGSTGLYWSYIEGGPCKRLKADLENSCFIPLSKQVQTCSGLALVPVSYTHLTLPTKRIV